MAIKVKIEDIINIELPDYGVAMSINHDQLDSETGQLPPGYLDRVLVQHFGGSTVGDRKTRDAVRAAVIEAVAAWWKAPFDI